MAAITGVRDALWQGAALAAPSHSAGAAIRSGLPPVTTINCWRLQGDNGAKRLLERDRASVTDIKVDDAGIFADIDIPGDLQHL